MIHQPFFTPAILFVLLSLPLVQGWVPRNRYYGIRTRRAMADDAGWYRINRQGGWAVIIAGLFYLVLAMVFPVVGQDDFSRWLVHLAVFALPLLGCVLRVRHLSRLD